MNLEEYLKEYRALTLDIMDRIIRDGKIAVFIKEREDILQKINSINPDRQMLIEMCKSLNIIELEKEMQMMMNRERAAVKNKIKDLKKRRQGNEQYMHSLQMRYVKSSFDGRY